MSCSRTQRSDEGRGSHSQPLGLKSSNLPLALSLCAPYELLLTYGKTKENILFVGDRKMTKVNSCDVELSGTNRLNSSGVHTILLEKIIHIWSVENFLS